MVRPPNHAGAIGNPQGIIMTYSTVRLGIILALGILVASLAARAQQADRMRKVGVLQPYAEHDPEGQRRFAALIQGLQDLGWQEGRNMTLEMRYAGGSSIHCPLKSLSCSTPMLISSLRQAQSLLRPLERLPQAFLLSWRRLAILSPPA